MSKFNVGDEVVVRSGSPYYGQRKYGKAVVESVLSAANQWDVLVRYEEGIGLLYKFHDLDKAVKFKGNK